MPSANNDFANAQLLTGASGTSAFFTIDTDTTEAGEPTGSELENPPVQQSMWFKWVATSTDYFVFGTSLSTTADAGSMDSFGNLDTTMGIWTGTILSDLTPVTSNDDVSGSHWWSECRFLATVGETYYIQVGTYDTGYIGEVKVDWAVSAAAPTNDDFEDAIVMTGDSWSTSGTVRYATAQEGETFWRRSVWWKWTPTTDRDVTLTASMTTSNDDDFFVLDTYNGTQISNLVRRSSEDSFPPAGTDDAVCVFRAIANETVYISVSGDTRGNSPPDFDLDLASVAAAAAPANDSFASASTIAMTFTPTSTSAPPQVNVFYQGTSAGAQSTANARHEIGERPITGVGGFSAQKNGDQSVWYKFTGPAWRGTATVTRPSNTLVAVYTGTSVESLTLIKEVSAGASFTFETEINTVYYISVSGFPNTLTGVETNNTNFTLTITVMPIISIYNPNLEFRALTTKSDGPVISTTVDKPAGTTAGDVLLMFLVRKVAAGGGFDALAAHEFVQIDFGAHTSYEFSAVDVYMKIAGESEPASYTLAQTSGSAYWFAILTAYSTDPNIWRQGLDSDMWSGYAVGTTSEKVDNPPDVGGGSEDFLSGTLAVTGEGLLLQYFEGQTQEVGSAPTSPPTTTIDTGSPTLRGELTASAVPSNNTVSARMRTTEESASAGTIPAVKTTITWTEDLTFHSLFQFGAVASNIRRLYLGGVVRTRGAGSRREAEFPKVPRAEWKDHPYRLRSLNG